MNYTTTLLACRIGFLGQKACSCCLTLIFAMIVPVPASPAARQALDRTHLAESCDNLAFRIRGVSAFESGAFLLRSVSLFGYLLKTIMCLFREVYL
jgi:hypothetical protein